MVKGQGGRPDRAAAVAVAHGRSSAPGRHQPPDMGRPRRAGPL